LTWSIDHQAEGFAREAFMAPRDTVNDPGGIPGGCLDILKLGVEDAWYSVILAIKTRRETMSVCTVRLEWFISRLSRKGSGCVRSRPFQ
jgi:hypothetical protein